MNTFYPELGETLFTHTLPNGLPIIVLQKPGFTRKIAYFTTDYGAVHRTFTLNGQTCTAPDGVAHYLEHKLFDMPGRDITQDFAALGASCNAFTSYDMTAYYFSCSENFRENLRLLLQFVSTPYFTEESVAKEQGIIGQEIGMNDDSPENRIFENLMRGLYHNHPIRVPILGTRESIQKITPETLRLCHKAFYSPNNMLLCVVGDADPEEVVALAEETLQHIPRADLQVQRDWEEEMTAAAAFQQEAMDVAMPMFQLGFKAEPIGTGEDAICREIVGDLAAELLFGESSALYLKLYGEGVIDSSFGGGFETVAGVAMLTASGDSDYPEAVRDAILEEARRLCQEGICEQDFLRMKRSAIGRRIRSLDSFDATAFRLCAYHFSGFDYFRFPAVYQRTTRQELLEFLGRVVTPERCSLSVIVPNT